MRSSKLKVQSSKNSPQSAFEDWELEVVPEWAREEVGPAVLSEGNGAAKPYELGERTALFGEEVVRFAKKVPRHPANDRLISQIVGAGTSVGANYCEANEAVSRKDFLNTVGRCVKEAKETRFFLRMIVASEPAMAIQARPLWIEATELLRILASIRKRPGSASWQKPE